MSSGGSKNVVEILESVQQSTVRGPRAPDQRAGVEGAGLFSFGDKEKSVEEEVEWYPWLLGRALLR